MDGQELTTENVTPVNVSSSPSPMDARTMHLQLQSPNAQIISPSFDVGDLISYEYFDTASGKMQCGLATVLEKLEENKLLVEPLMHEARRSLCGVVAITDEGNSILEELRNLEKEFLRCVKDAKQSSQEIWERRCAVQEKQEVEEAVIIAQEELGDVRTAVKKIDIHHWHELVSYRTPPEIVVRVMAAVVLVLGERRRTWAEIMPILHRPGITELLATFDSSDLTQAQREEVLQRYINTPKFTYEGVMKGSIALTELYRWVVAHVLMINVNEHRNQMSRINERCSSDPEELEQKLQEDFRKIARLNIEMNALWNRLYEVESKAASNFCASNNTTPRENQSARQRCSHKGLFERPLFAELIKMISGSWHYKIKPERRSISICSVLCNLGAAPDRNETIILQEQNSLHLLAAMQAKKCQYTPIIQSETETYGEEAANTHGIQQKRKPQRKAITQLQYAQNIKTLVQQIQKNAEEKLQLQQRILLNTRSKNTGESQLRQKLSQEIYTKEREENDKNAKTFTRNKHFYTQDSPRTPTVQRRLDLSGNEKHLQKNRPSKGFDVLATLERQLQERDDALAALKDRLEEYGREKSALESRSSESVDALAALERQLQERDDALAALKDRLEEHGREKSALESPSSESVDALAALERQLQERDDALAALKDRLEEHGREKSALESRSSESVDALAAMERQLQQRDDALAALERQLQQRDDALAALERQLQERDDALAALKDRLEEHGREKSALESPSSESVDALAALERQLQERDDALAALKDRLEEHGREKSALESPSSESVDALAALERQLQQRDDALAALERQLQERDDALAALKDRLEEHGREKSALESPSSESVDALAAMERQLQQRDDALAALERQLQQRDDALAAMERQLQERDDALAALKDRLEEHGREKSALESRSSESVDALAALERQLQQRDDALAALKDRLEEHGREKSALESRSSESVDALAAMERQLQQRDDALAALERQLQQRDDALAALERQLQERDDALAALKDRLEEHGREKSALESPSSESVDALAALERQLQERDDALAALKDRLEEHGREKSALESRSSESVDALAALERQLQQRDDALAALERQLQERDDALAALKDRLEEHGREKSALESPSSERDDALAALERQLQERDDALAALKDRLEEHGREKSALGSRSSESVDALAAMERQLQQRDDALAALKDRLEEYGREKSALGSRSSESVDALAAMERQLQQRDDALAALERQLQERCNVFNIFDGRVNEICMEKPSLGFRLKTATDMFVVFLRRLRGFCGGEYGVSFQDGLCTFHHAQDSGFVSCGVFKSLRSLRNFVFGWNWNGNCMNEDWWDVLGHVQLELGCVEAELHEFSEFLRKLEEDCKDTEPTRRLQELIDIHAGYGENEDAALNLEENFEVLILELRHRVCEMKTMLVGQSVRERLIQARIDALSSGIHRVANLSVVLNGEVDKDKRRRALEELHEKHDSLSEELSSVGRDLFVLYALQQGREETFLRPLHEYSPFLAAKCLRNAGFLTDTIETGVFSLTSGVLMVAVIVTLTYKRYSLI